MVITMPEAEAESEAALMVSVVASLSKSFDQVPPSAVPAVLDCILVSTGLSSSSLFASLLHDFPRFLKVFIHLLHLSFQFLYGSMHFLSTMTNYIHNLIFLLVDLYLSRSCRIEFVYIYLLT